MKMFKVLTDVTRYVSKRFKKYYFRTKKIGFLSSKQGLRNTILEQKKSDFSVQNKV
jgi:hypothetical protein